jgi:putative ABC transport system permease protein
VVTAGYFRTIGVQPALGRDFTELDRADAPEVAIVNEAAVRRFLPEGSPLGRRIRVGDDDAWLEIVGVVPDLRQFGPTRPAEPEIYGSAAQFTRRQLFITVRAEGDPLLLVGSLRAAVHDVDPNLPVERFRTLDEIVAGTVAPQRFFGSLITLFAALALALAAIGIFGVTSYTVAQRTREIGIRMALGAEPRAVVRLIVARAAGLALLGAGIGVLGALAFTRVLQGQLFGVAATDPLTFVTVVLLLGAIAVVASYIPGRAATRVDPLIALREE